MKTFVKLMTLIVLFSLVVSCGGTPATAPSAPATQAPAVPVLLPTATMAPVAEPSSLTANEQWAKDNGLGPYQPATDDWAAIEAAAKLEGSSMCLCQLFQNYENCTNAWKALIPGHQV